MPYEETRIDCDVARTSSPAPSPYNSDVEEEDGADGIPMDDEALRHYIDANRVCRTAPRNEDNDGDEGNLSNSDDDDDDEGEE
eukprot:scaffold41637_cov82-Cyclotella_meneghiniana.AAC.2